MKKLQIQIIKFVLYWFVFIFKKSRKITNTVTTGQPFAIGKVFGLGASQE